MTFPEKVVLLVRAIPPGKVMNYGLVARLLDNPRASRAVGFAMAALPFGSDVPWHRVVGKEGQMGKISHRALTPSADKQYQRLVAEGIVFDENRQFLLPPYLWQPTPPEVQAILSAQDPA